MITCVERKKQQTEDGALWDSPLKLTRIWDWFSDPYSLFFSREVRMKLAKEQVNYTEVLRKVSQKDLMVNGVKCSIQV